MRDTVELSVVAIDKPADTNAIKQVPEVCGIYCATANPVELVIAETGLGRGIVGVIDGSPPLGVETDTDVADRKALLRTIGYKL